MKKIDPPLLTFPPLAVERVRQEYAAAETILEYGTGGSTALAAGMEQKHIFSVESDADWCADMVAYFQQNPPRSQPILIPIDIGPVGKWGRPVDASSWQMFQNYPVQVWDDPRFRHPDLVLIDGRFRPACFLTVLHRIERPVRVLFDDYAAREEYHFVEAFVKPTELVDRMAVFDLGPTDVDWSHCAAFLKAFTSVSYARQPKTNKRGYFWAPSK